MNTFFRPLTALVLGLSLSGVASMARANDFPTVDRVLYVQECMNKHPGPGFEMINKCSCAVDRLAEELPYDDYVTMSTAAKAVTIGGEFGGALRGTASLKPLIKRYQDLQAQVEKACFVVR